jgi:hypothetical protein
MYMYVLVCISMYLGALTGFLLAGLEGKLVSLDFKELVQRQTDLALARLSGAEAGSDFDLVGLVLVLRGGICVCVCGPLVVCVARPQLVEEELLIVGIVGAHLTCTQGGVDATVEAEGIAHRLPVAHLLGGLIDNVAEGLTDLAHRNEALEVHVLQDLRLDEKAEAVLHAFILTCMDCVDCLECGAHRSEVEAVAHRSLLRRGEKLASRRDELRFQGSQ